jgi:hypothetical protein
MNYEQWKLKLIEIIVGEKRIDEFTKIQEVQCVLNDDCDYPSLYKDGDTPEDVWQNEIEALADTQEANNG